MIAEPILAGILALNLFIALTTNHVVWRCLCFKIALDSLSVFLMSFGGAQAGDELRILGIALIFTSTAVLFLFLVVVYGTFREQKNEKN